MRCLVTGGTGFIGSHLVELLVAGGWEVVCPVRTTNALRHLECASAEVIPTGALPNYIRSGPGFDYVFHLAGATRARDYRAYQAANVKYTWLLLDTLSNTKISNRPKRFVLVSSQSAAGPCRDDCTPVTESDEPRPVSLYGRSKLEAEVVAASFQDRLPVTIVRPPTVFGPRDTDVLGVFKSACFRIAAYLAGPDRRVSIIYVEDLVKGILHAALSPAAEGSTFFLANSEPVIWRQFAFDVANVMGCSVLPLPVPYPVAKVMALCGDVICKVSNSPPLFRSEKLEEMMKIAWVCSPEKARRELGWQSSTPLREAIGKTAEWYRSHGWI